jgi:hypothetical protein
MRLADIHWFVDHLAWTAEYGHFQRQSHRGFGKEIDLVISRDWLCRWLQGTASLKNG